MFSTAYFPAAFFPKYFPKGVSGSFPPQNPPNIFTIGPIPVTGGGVRATFSSSESGVTGYDIDYDGAVTTGVTSPRDYTIADLSAAHRWRVRATNGFGNGPWTNYLYLGGASSGSARQVSFVNPLSTGQKISNGTPLTNPFATVLGSYSIKG